MKLVGQSLAARADQTPGPLMCHGYDVSGKEEG